MTKIWVTGEALIDFVPREFQGKTGFLPLPGGSTYNVAKAIARQNGNVEFIGDISEDLFGQRLVADLQASGVKTQYAKRTPHPCTLAFVEFDGKNARYAFFNNQSATALTEYQSRSIPIENGDILHLGSISLIDEPGASNIANFGISWSEKALLTLDPNARPSLTHDIKQWRKRIFDLMEHVSFLKLSDEDLDFLIPEKSHAEFAQDMLNKGMALVVVTKGEKGAIAYSKSGQVDVEARCENIIDTVGAGDTVTGSLLTQIAELGLTSREKLATLGREPLKNMMERSMMAAWLNCQKEGCNPPSHSELETALASETAST